MLRYESWPKSLNTAKKTPYVGSRSFKVIEFVTNRKGTCDFTLVVNSNIGHISHSFGATATYWSKIVSVAHAPVSLSVIAVGVTNYCEYVDEPYIDKTRYIVLPICLFVSDERTDRNAIANIQRAALRRAVKSNEYSTELRSVDPTERNYTLIDTNVSLNEPNSHRSRNKCS